MSELSSNDNSSSNDTSGAASAATGGGGGGTPAAPGTATAATAQIADMGSFLKYLKQVVSVLVDINQASLNEFEKTINDKSNAEYIKKFLGDPQTRNLIIQKYQIKDEEEGEQVGVDDSSPSQFLICNEIHYTSPKCISIQLIKRGAIIESDKKLNSQIRVISLEDSSPYETLHSYVSNTLAPYFKSYIKRGSSDLKLPVNVDTTGSGRVVSTSGGVNELNASSSNIGVGSGSGGSGGSGSVNDQFATIMEKQLDDVATGLLHLQQNIDIPEINLVIHPTVLQIVKRSSEENRKPRLDDFADKVEDANFLNQLQSGVSRWIKEIKKVTKLDRDPSTGTALQEISFWLNLERALNRILEKRESSEVTLTLEILRYGKRFIATVSFDSDTGLKEALETAKDYNQLMKDFPLNDLIKATELNSVIMAIQNIFNHLKKIRNTKYPINRALKLIYAISKDLTSQLLKILSTQRLMLISFDDFEKTMKACFAVFTVWDDEYEKLQGILRDLAKRKRDDFKLVWKITPSHKELRDRLIDMQKFRRQHEQLRTVISRVLRPAISQENDDLNGQQSNQVAQRTTIDAGLDVADANAIEEVSLAYEKFKEVDALDISEKGQVLWKSATDRYEERIERVEARMTARLRDQLGTAKNANEMFRIFSRFNALFVRTHIRGAIVEYQAQLIQRVKDDIEALQEKFKAQYIQSKSYRMSKIRDIPPVAGSIIWAKQIERQLNMYMKRVEDVLGKGWETHVEGQKLKADGDNFRLKLNTQELFEDWSRKVSQKNLQNSGRIFLVDTIRASKGTIYTLKVNFSPEIITLTKEARNMKWLVSRVPLGIVNKAHTARQMYPYAISLIENVGTYKRICERVNEKRTCQLLVAGMKKDIQNLILDMSSLVWDSYKLESSVQKFSDSIYNFREKVDELISVETTIDQQLKELDSCPYDETKFAEVLYEIQKSIDYLNLKGFSNLPQWVSKLDEEIERKFAQRLSIAIKVWIDVLMDRKNKQEDDAPIVRRRKADNQTESLGKLLNVEDMLGESSAANEAELLAKMGGEPKIKAIILEILIRNQFLYIHPSVEDAREHLISQLYEFSSIITTQKRIQHSRYQVTMEAESEYKMTYKNLLNKFTSGIKLLEYAFGAIDAILNQAQEFVKTWLNFQSLWDLQPDNLYTQLGNNLNAWICCLNEMKESRKSFDTQETNRKFGPIMIDYNKVQSKVNVKYDAWHKEVLSKFGLLLGNELQDFHSTVSKSRSDLESQSVEASSTSEAVSVITYVQSLKRKLKDWERKVDSYTNAQKILERQRYQFPSNWLYSDYIQGEWGAFNEILKRKDSSIQNQVASLQAKVISEEKVVENRTNELIHEWDVNKPVNGQLKPDQALKSLQVFETKFNRIKEERDNMVKAKDALELRDNVSSSNDLRITVSIEEMQDLKGVWSELAKIWSKIDEQKEKQWLTVQPRKLRATLDGLLQQLRDMPSRLRQYDSYNFVKKLLQDYLKANLLIIELKSEALKERHWKQLMKKMNVVWNLNDLTLGQIWDINLLLYEAIIKDIIMVAQGEKALEEFLKQVSELWKNYTLELINYQNKCQIIRGWDDLFNKLKEHINSVSAMKLSPYYKEFEEEALSWEDKLNRINAVFDVWIDVQRRWVYLDGIFGGSADIKHLLPNETQKFQNVSSEFLTLMRKVSKSPLVLDILNIQGIQKTLERLADLLAKIQKALGEYLERERSSFPRFYFVGDEDLLEIIGNTKNVPRLQKHFKKMFAGVYSILLNDDNTIVLGVSSKEGEEVIFKTPVSIAANPKINDWLTLVEREIRTTLASLLNQSVNESSVFRSGSIDLPTYLNWVDSYQAQLIVLSAQISWSESVEAGLRQLEANPQLVAESNPLSAVLSNVENTLKVLADSVLQDQAAIRRRKLEHLIIEHVHQRDVLRDLIAKKITSPKSFDWLAQMRFYFDPKVTNLLKQLTIHMANSKFHYGFEYLGVQDKLVQTPLTDRCYLTMTQALEARLGGSPFGPAGTGKTESVKALGHQLGRFVVVFNCDETFDFQAMGRIFVGLCQVGAWGCFDEFNRLEERMLSAVSQQIQTIQEALKEHQQQQLSSSESGKPTTESILIELVGKQVTVNPHMAIFITMNPGYAGRSNLPDNLKKLFRSLAMTQPDNVLIAQVMLYSQGFRSAEKLAHKVVPFFKLCNEQLSSQSHYDFGLRSLKSVLVMAGNVKRERIQRIREKLVESNQAVDESKIAENLNEQEILIQSIMESFVPRLINEDLPLLQSLLNDVFPGVKYEPIEIAKLKEEIRRVCRELYLICDDPTNENATGNLWLEKVLQLYSISNLNHGLMMVGPSGSGKSTAWKVLLRALEKYEGVEGVAHIIDPKAISKDALYGSMDPNTREWTDGLFTHILRKIIDNVRGELNKRQWIIFDGDVDPEWVENLNSVLDDNKLLTLPNGERLNIPPNVRIMFEVQDLRYATLATVSRCGMIWFSEDVLSLEMIYENYFGRLCNMPLEGGEDEDIVAAMAAALVTNDLKLKRSLSQPSTPNETQPNTMQDFPQVKNAEITNALADQRSASAYLKPFFTPDGLVTKCLEYAGKFEHIMDFTRLRALGSMFTMLNQAVRNLLVYNQQHDFRLSEDVIEKYITKSLVLSVLWSFSGDCKLKYRCDLGEFIRSSTTIPMPIGNTPIIDYEVVLTSGEWVPWLAKVPQIEVETHKVAAPDVVVPTIDTIRHESLLFTWLSEHKPLLLCGPPGSGKTMTLFAALRSLPDLEVVGLNFSSATTPELMLKTFDHYCEYKRTPNGIVLSPIQLGKWLVIFCDEINLPDEDKYGTQRVISFIRQCIEHNGFYRTSDQSWVKLERIQFVGACNPPTDPGRKPLSHRFLRHVPLVYVDYPGELSLKQIYGTFNRAMLRIIPSLRVYAEPLTNAMVEFYLLSQERFTVDQQPHYIYSPREMTRWVRGICEAIRPLEHMSVEELVRLFVHEALRLFQDRLVSSEERIWTDENINSVALKHFSNMDAEKALKRPILYSNWLRKDYLPVDQEELREYVKARLKVFYEEELDVPLVLFNEVLDHVLRIDRIFRQPQGHLLLIGVSGAGKTTLSRFVAWINGLSVFQIKVHNNYSGEDFDNDLRNVLRRSGTKGEKIVFILDESNVLDSGFLERMNTLLANGEVPGLFEGDEYSTLMTQCKEGAQRDGLMLDSSEELYKWFTNEVMKNLHVVFTMNPSQDGLKSRASTSPALFNRCVLNWFGDWSHHAYYQVGKEFTIKIDLEKSDFLPPESLLMQFDKSVTNITHREAVVNTFVQIHDSLHQANHRLQKKGVRTTTITPRHYLDFINHFAKLYNEKRSELEDQQVHLNIGLSKIKETVEQVEELQKSLAVKRTELEKKNNEANFKLKQMMNDQQEAEKKKVTSQELQQIINRQMEEIDKKKSSVMDDLSKVEPAVAEAQNAVKSIKRQHLVELKAMVNPPAAVKLGLESICLILNQETSDWKVIRGIIVKDNFINTIINFQTDNITPQIKEKMKTRFLNNPDYEFTKVNNASQACGPLVKWATAQIQYAEMLHKVEPLRDELNSLEKAAKENELKARELEEVINQLEKSISQYKLEYAELISQAQIIKSDLNSVESKVERSVALLKSLSNEQTRWDSSSESFKVQMSTIVGDVLLSSALMAYGGYYDQAMRNSLFNTWTSSLHNANIKFKEDLARIEYLSNADERMSWHACSLPTDDLCIENAIMLKRFNRYPLIIDPSGQATEFILNMYKDRKITKTSFLDYSFRKNLESSLRFGNPILIQDVENYDPILNPVLNREIRRTGGRVLITLGDQDIDFSPMFTMFLSTRDPTVEFPPDICSRVTFVNFTVTRASLQAQCLHQVLKCERPDVEEKRLDLLKIQGEFQQRLRHLEKDLLGALNESKGKILNDDTIISRLENLKKEAAEISKKVAETDFVMKEVETVINQYSGLSQACSSIYFTMDVLNQIHTLYQYSLQYFLEIFTTVLTQNANLKDVKDSQQRLKIIARDLFYLAYYRLARGMLHDDRIVLALLLAKIYLKGFMKNNTESASIEGYFRSLMNSNVAGLVESKEDKEKSDKANSLNAEQTEAINYLTKMSDFKNLKSIIRDNSDDFYTWLESANPEKNVPDVLWSTPGNSQAPALATGAFDLAEICNLLKKLLLVKAMRPDRFISIAEMFINNIFGDAFLEQTERMVELANIVENEIKSTTPILMCSVTGYDASGRVEDLAAETNKQLIAIAIGSSEGFTQAEKAINTSSKTGKWVLLKNVHLATQWLVQLEKKLHNLQPHPAFRIFLAMEITPKIPSNLLRLGRCLVFEPPPGIKANLMRTLSVIPVSRMNKVPAERSRLYFLLCWLHAITQERLRYVPLGWSKTYEFNESDIRCGLDTIDVWIDSIAMGRNNLPPSKVPFSAIYTLLSECVYGGKIDNSFDRRLLNTFLKQLFSVGSFEADFRLVTDDLFNLNMPDAVKKEQFLEWIDNLKHQQTPSWLGLPNSAEKVLLAYNCREVVSKLLKLSIMDEEEEELAYDAEAGYKKSDSYEFANKPPSVDSRPSWMKLLNASVCEWLNVLPKSLSGIKRSQDNIKDPLFRFFEREINAGIKLLKTVLNDLSDVVSICEGNKKQTNYHRQILKDLAKGLIPRNWKRYTVPKDLIVQPWILDFSERIRQMAAISKQFNEQGLEALKGYVVWLGGLFTPEAYITATRQYVAQSNSWSLEELQLEMTVYENRNQMKSLDNCSFGLTGLKLQGAVCTNNKVNLSTNIVNNFNISVIKWTRINPASSAPTTSRLNLPIYLNSTRAELLFTINLDTDQNENLFYMRGVAILASSLAG